MSGPTPEDLDAIMAWSTPLADAVLKSVSEAAGKLHELSAHIRATVEAQAKHCPNCTPLADAIEVRNVKAAPAPDGDAVERIMELVAEYGNGRANEIAEAEFGSPAEAEKIRDDALARYRLIRAELRKLTARPQPGCSGQHLNLAGVAAIPVVTSSTPPSCPPPPSGARPAPLGDLLERVTGALRTTLADSTLIRVTSDVAADILADAVIGVLDQQEAERAPSDDVPNLDDEQRAEVATVMLAVSDIEDDTRNHQETTERSVEDAAMARINKRRADIRAAVARLIADRDGAHASYWNQREVVSQLKTQRDEARAEVEEMREVVEAARRWAGSDKGSGSTTAPIVGLLDAVKEYESSAHQASGQDAAPAVVQMPWVTEQRLDITQDVTFNTVPVGMETYQLAEPLRVTAGGFVVACQVSGQMQVAAYGPDGVRQAMTTAEHVQQKAGTVVGHSPTAQALMEMLAPAETIPMTGAELSAASIEANARKASGQEADRG